MCNFLTPLRGVETYAVVVRMVLAFVCSALIGFERSAKNQPAGMRTHILVCMASTVAATCGIFLYLKLELVSDISRIASMVVTGLGFIGAGTIVVKQKTAIRGLTTAAGLWTTGIIGICIGAGMELNLNVKHSLLLEGRFYYGLTDVFPNHKIDVFSASNPMSVIVTLGYFCNLTH